MTRYLTVVFQNVDGDGAATLRGDVVLTVETPFGASRPLASGRGWTPRKNPRMAASWRRGVEVVSRRRKKVHGATRTPPTPRRDVCEVVVDVRPWKPEHQPPDLVALIWGHAVNSAWAPRWKPTSFREERRQLWWLWYAAVLAMVRSARSAGCRPVVLCDANRMGRWTFPGMKVAWKHGPDRILVPKDGSVRVVRVETGPRTGDGRVTHPSVRVTLAVD